MPKVTTVRLEDAQLEHLSIIAGVHGRSVSDEIREAVSLFIDLKRQDPGFRSLVNLRIGNLIGTPPA